MPRKSPEAKAALALVASVPIERPNPPTEFSKTEAQQWCAIVSRMPPDWFTVETQPVLQALCCHIACSQMLEARLRAFDKRSLKTAKGLERFRDLTMLHVTQSKMVAALSVKLRLTPQSRYDRLTAGSAARRTTQSDVKPWDIVR